MAAILRPVSDSDPPRALLLTGTLGAGKTTVAIEIGEVLTEHATPHAVIDLDWLCWAGPDFDSETIHALLRDNLAMVAQRFRRNGIGSFVLARGLLDPSHREAVRAAMPEVDLRVVRLDASAATLRQRLTARDSGANLDTHLSELAGFTELVERARVEDAVVRNDFGPIREVALAALAAAGWTLR